MRGLPVVTGGTSGHCFAHNATSCGSGVSTAQASSNATRANVGDLAAYRGTVSVSGSSGSALAIHLSAWLMCRNATPPNRRPT
jgi:hypothetical protein